jgi:hypothetical protein
MYSSLAHQVLGKQQDTFQEEDRYNEAERIKKVALEYISQHKGDFEGFLQTEQQEDTFQGQDHDNETERMKGVAVDCTHKLPEKSADRGADRYGALAEDVGDFVQQMASDKCSYGDELILRATALSLKRNIRVFKYDDTSTGVDTAKISTLLYAALPDTTCQTMNQDATSDMLAEEETLKVAYYAWQEQGVDGHYNTFVSTTVSERSVEPSPVVGNVVDCYWVMLTFTECSARSRSGARPRVSKASRKGRQEKVRLSCWCQVCLRYQLTVHFIGRGRERHELVGVYDESSPKPE